MSREIKLRVLQRIRRGWGENPWNWSYFGPFTIHPPIVETKHDTIGEYTGLKDAKGVEIYEGDIVSDGWDVGVVEIGLCEDMTINCQEYSVPYCGVYLDVEDTNVEYRCAFKAWKVIGNIHENPEMLNGDG